VCQGATWLRATMWRLALVVQRFQRGVVITVRVSVADR
jgi:hypothetical protein